MINLVNIFAQEVCYVFLFSRVFLRTKKKGKGKEVFFEKKYQKLLNLVSFVPPYSSKLLTCLSSRTITGGSSVLFKWSGDGI